MNLQDNCMHNFEDNICKTCGAVKLDENGLSKERNQAIDIMEWQASKLGDEEMFDGELWYEIEDGITKILEK
jgi:hypothetical protein